MSRKLSKRELSIGMNLRAFFYALFALLCLGESRSCGSVDCWQQGQGHFAGTDAGSSFSTRDHLGSIRELTGGTGTVRARYDYDPHGTREKLSGDRECAFVYTGHSLATPTTSAASSSPPTAPTTPPMGTQQGQAIYIFNVQWLSPEF